MQPITEERITSFVQEVVRETSPQSVYLFGSRARGDARADSDADILVVHRAPFGPAHSRRTELARLWHIAARLRLPVDSLLYSAGEVDQLRTSRGHVVARAVQEGRLIYAAD